MGKGARGQAELAAVVRCLVLVSAIAMVVLVIVLGGRWRAEATCSFQPTVTGTTVPFEDNLTAHHFLFGLIKGGQPHLDLVLGKYLTGDAQMKELTVITRHTFTDSLVAGATAFIYCPVTVTVRGEFVRPPSRQQAGSPPVRPATVSAGRTAR